MPTMSSQPFNIPGISLDLRREETIHQVADSLDYLDRVAQEIFTRIHNRVVANQAKLNQINDRVNLAQAKIDKIKGSKKATKVFASAKYPSAESNEDYKTIFHPDNVLSSPKRPNYHVQAKHRGVDDKVIRDKLQASKIKYRRNKKADETKGEGLGGLPKTIPSVSSLILFNTSENPYKKYVMLDPLGVITKTRTALDEEEAVMADAPDTIKTNEELKRQQMENYFYVPGMGEVPELDVPIALPNLLGVADDVTYTEGNESSIAPTIMGGNMPDLPSVVPEGDPVPAGPATDSGGAPPPPPPPAGPPPPGPPPPPPPPPPPGPPPPGAPAPPPPPAPAPGPPPPPPAEDIPEEVASSDGGRANLMDAIRKAGGAGKVQLKSAKERKTEIKKKKNEEKATGGGGGGGGMDLMGQLAAQLGRRRKGISGTGKANEGGGGEKSENPSGSALDKMSAMIPAMPKADDSKGAADADEDDWE